jgi:hypothetical protein
LLIEIHLIFSLGTNQLKRFIMNNTAYNSLKKLFLMSLILFAGAAFAQSSNNADLLGTTKPGVTSKPATQSTSEVKPVTTFNTSAKPVANSDNTDLKQKRAIAAANATTSPRKSNPTPGSQADVKQQIAKIDAKLASNDPRLTTAARAKLQARRNTLSQQLTK